MQPITTLQTRNHAAYRLHYYVVLVIKYRNRVITDDMQTRLRDVFTHVLSKWECGLTECNGESDHVHLLIETHPALDLSRLVGNLKTVSARRMRQEFSDHLVTFFSNPYFWSRAYGVTTTGGASLDTVRDYVRSQGERE